MNIQDKANIWLKKSLTDSDKEIITEAQTIITELIKDNAAWRRNSARKATVAAKVQFNHQTIVNQLKSEIVLVIPQLLKVATGEIEHIYSGLCPDRLEGPNTRDPICPACQILIEADKALQV